MVCSDAPTALPTPRGFSRAAQPRRRTECGCITTGIMPSVLSLQVSDVARCAKLSGRALAWRVTTWHTDRKRIWRNFVPCQFAHFCAGLAIRMGVWCDSGGASCEASRYVREWRFTVLSLRSAHENADGDAQSSAKNDNVRTSGFQCWSLSNCLRPCFARPRFWWRRRSLFFFSHVECCEMRRLRTRFIELGSFSCRALLIWWHSCPSVSRPV